MDNNYRNKRRYNAKHNKYNTFEFEKRLQFYKDKTSLKSKNTHILKRLYKLLTLFVCILLLIIFVGCCKIGFLYAKAKIDSNYIEPEIPITLQSSDIVETVEEKVSKANILSLGNLMCHNTQYFDAKTDVSYDFDYVFKDVSDIFSKPDFTIATFETTLAGSEKGYSNYPKFNTPDEFSTAISNSGIDLVSNATNHCLDYDSSGLERTNTILKTNGLQQIGTGKNLQFSNKINDITFTYFAYTYETNVENIDDDIVVNLIEKEKMKQDLLNSTSDINIVLIHWGSEYSQTNTTEQEELADFLIENGADIILGNHPHIIQPIEIREVNGRQGLVVYSHGNLTSDMKNIDNQISIGVDLEFVKDKNEISTTATTIPLFMFKNTNVTNKKFKLIDLTRIELYDESLQTIFKEKKDLIESKFTQNTWTFNILK